MKKKVIIKKLCNSTREPCTSIIELSNSLRINQIRDISYSIGELSNSITELCKWIIAFYRELSNSIGVLSLLNQIELESRCDVQLEHSFIQLESCPIQLERSLIE